MTARDASNEYLRDARFARRMLHRTHA